MVQHLHSCHTARHSKLHCFCELLHLMCHGSMFQTNFRSEDFPALTAIGKDAASLAVSNFFAKVFTAANHDCVSQQGFEILSADKSLFFGPFVNFLFQHAELVSKRIM